MSSGTSRTDGDVRRRQQCDQQLDTGGAATSSGPDEPELAGCARTGARLASTTRTILWLLDYGITSSVAAPITVEGRLWGYIAAFNDQDRLPPETEARLAGFTDLVATAIANAESRAQFMASRARIVAAADEARRRIERDLHDGAQQSLVSAALKLKLAEQASGDGAGNAMQLIHEAAESTEQAIEELGELARGIHPAVLTRSGLTAALKTLARRSPIPVVLDVPYRPGFPSRTEVTAYFVVSEALTNTAKHSPASEVRISVAAIDGKVRLSVDDDGVGGARLDSGSGLVGLNDRIEAAGGTLSCKARWARGRTSLSSFHS